MQCPRCTHAMISDSFTDLLDDSGVLGITAWRCLTCGEVVDPVILANRTNRPEPFVSKSRKNWGA
ncbi:MAG: hypothetical protein OEW11_04945 [Nitrospirota bacterium]|nr:hypothetical protein [Nitrospirota bacterium]